MVENKSNIALLLGDPAGIGPELVSKLLNDDITKKANIADDERLNNIIKYFLSMFSKFN